MSTIKVTGDEGWNVSSKRMLDMIHANTDSLLLNCSNCIANGCQFFRTQWFGHLAPAEFTCGKNALAISRHAIITHAISNSSLCSSVLR